jgi:hypothetical protein
MCLGKNADGPERFEAEGEYRGQAALPPGLLQELQFKGSARIGSLSRLSRRLRSQLAGFRDDVLHARTPNGPPRSLVSTHGPRAHCNL